MDYDYLGNGPMYDNDPFICGTLSPEQDDHYFEDFYANESQFDEKATAEQSDKKRDEFDLFHQDDTSPFTLAVGGASDGFSMDAAYDQFNFDFTNTFVDTAMPDVEELDHRMQVVIDEVASIPDARSQSYKVDSPLVAEVLASTTVEQDNGSPAPVNDIPVVVTNAEPPAQASIEQTKASAVKSVKAAVPKEAAPEKPSVPVAKNGDQVPKQRTLLFPVKIKKMVPQMGQMARPCISNSPYAIGPVPPRRSHYGLENIPDYTTLLGTSSLLDNVDGKNLKTSSVIPRDQQSNHFRCTQCQCSFTSQLALTFHEVEKHSAKYAYECLECHKIYADIREVNKHIQADHGKKTIPLLDNSIIGNGDVLENGRRASQRRVSGMIWSFINNRVKKSGKGRGLAEHKEIVDREVRALLSTSTDNAMTDATFPLDQIQVEDTATINDLLRRQYIYGPSIRRLMLNSVPPAKVIRRRTYEIIAQERKSQIDAKKILVSSSYTNQKQDAVQPPSNTQVIVQQVPTRVFIQPKPTLLPSDGQVVNIVTLPSRKTYVLNRAVKRTAPVSQNWDRNKMIRVEMPPMLEHYAARDRNSAFYHPEPR